ncbi:MAG TPA: helix-turn-helix domain-containing protein [Candidatus Paceibacterota bacterium]
MVISRVVAESLGLSPNEARIYEALVERGESGVSEIALFGNIHRRNAYDAIRRLVEKGLCFQIFSGGENKYNAVDPDKLAELLAENSERLQKVLPELKKKFVARVAPEEAYIYHGLEGQKNIWRDVLRVGEDSYFIGAKGGWFDPRLTLSNEAFFKEANRKKIKFIQLFDYEVKDQLPDFPNHFPGKLEYRFLDKKYSTDSGIHIFGDYVITYTGLHINKLAEDLTFFVIHSKNLATSYRIWFWSLWNFAIPPQDRKRR